MLGTFPCHLISDPQQPYRVTVAIVTTDVSKPTFQKVEELSVNIMATTQVYWLQSPWSSHHVILPPQEDPFSVVLLKRPGVGWGVG